MNDSLHKLGISNIFDSDNELSFIEGENYSFNTLLQRAGVIFNEEGVEAASYIVEAGDPSGYEEIIREINFTLDKPFMFIIKSEYSIPLYNYLLE